MKQANTRSVVLAAILAAVMMVPVAYYWPIQEAYDPMNPAWNGCSTIANTSPSLSLLLSYDKPLPNGPSLLAIIGPSTGFSGREDDTIRNFLENGGTVLLADDFGTGNELLQALGVDARYSKKPLADLVYYSKSPSFPLITDFSGSPVTGGVTTIVLNHPSYIQIGNSSQTTELASSSSFAFIDATGQNRPEANETLNAYPVMASVNVGKGSLIMVSDPGMFANEIVGLYSNMRLFQNALQMGNGSLLFDVAHLGRAPLTTWRVLLRSEVNSVRDIVFSAKEGAYLQFLLVAVLVLGFCFQLFRLTRRRRLK